MSILRDDEERISEVLHATPLKPVEYVWGKYLGVLVAFLIALVVHLVAMIVVFQFLPIENAAEVRGPFRLGNFLVPMLVFGLPMVLFYGGLTFAVGERTRRPILIFVVPTAAILACAFFLWSWSPSWLDPRIDRLLMILEPTGYRWLNQTWLELDRGVDYYNTARLSFDGTFWLNRLWILLAPLLAVASSVSHIKRVTAGDVSPRGSSRLGRLVARLRGSRSGQQTASATPPTPPAFGTGNLADVDMSQKPTGFLSGTVAIARAELRELRGQPGLYLFVPLILLQIIGSSLFALGAFDTPVLLTSGTVAVRSLNTITFLVCLLLLFYSVESLSRELRNGADSLVFSTPVKTSALLAGKAIANSFVGMVVVIGAFLGAAISILIQGKTAVELGPFALVWGVLLFPTFLVWSAFVMALYSLIRERYTTYGLALAGLAATGWYQLTGKMTWVFNWNLWNTLRWSDMGTFELGRTALLLNRVTTLGAAVVFLAIAVRTFRRRDLDPVRISHRLHPKQLLRGAIRLAPFFALPAIAGGVLAWQVRDGFQGEVAEKLQKDYWRRNLATWNDAPLPAVDNIDLVMKLEPAAKSFEVEGTYSFRNHLEEPLRAFPLTGSWAFEDLEWTLNGEPFEPENHSNLFIVRPEVPLAHEETLDLGFSLRGTFPKGSTKNGGGSSLFVLPSGTVLHVFAPAFMPIPGFIESVGVDEDNQYQPREFEEDFWEDELTPGLGSPTPFSSRVEVTAPAEYTVNSVGELIEVRTHGDHRTVIWQSDYPVKLLNIVAGRYEVARDEGVAVFYHHEHDYNIEEITSTLAAARKHYSRWFHPYPWKELKLSEFPNQASYAQGFPTNITFSEGIGFLTLSEPKTNLAFMVTAHEAAHQWWGNMITPGVGPGGNILSEGMSHYSTLLLSEEVVGLRERIEFAKRIEERYGERRRADSERPLTKIDGSRAGDTTVTYDKGGWVMWMMTQELGREQTLAGLQQFFRDWMAGPDHPVLQDLIEALRPYASDAESFQRFVDQWYFDVVVPEYELSEAVTTRLEDGRYRVAFDIENAGTGIMPVDVAVVRGVRFPDEPDEPAEPSKATADPFQEQRTTVTLGAGESKRVTLELGFEPERVVVDPDAVVLQLDRKRAVLDVGI